MGKTSKLLAILLAIATLSVALIFTQTRVVNVSRLILYRVTIPSAQRALCAAKRTVQPLHRSSAVCENLDLSPILRANRHTLENPNATVTQDGAAKIVNDGEHTAAEVVTRAHARHHLVKRITLISSSLNSDASFVGKDLMPQPSLHFPDLNRSVIGCIPLSLEAPGLTEEGSAHDASSEELPVRFFLLQGFGLANVGLFEGPSGIVLIDTAESSTNLMHALQAFWRSVPCAKKYLLAALISHHHTDHIGGLQAINQYNTQVAGERGEGPPPRAKVIAHEMTIALYTETFLQHPQAKYRRGLKQFGASEYLDLEPLYPFQASSNPPGVVSAGIGRSLGHIDGAGGVIYPTHEWRGQEATLYFENKPVQMRLLPGETSDQICFMMPDLETLFASDNFYFAFPNIYPLRGGVFRSPMDWVSSLDIMLDEYVPQSTAMAMGHTSPVFGRERILALLERYRDSIQFVRDQTMRLMNRLQDPDAIARGVADLFWTTFPKPEQLTIDDLLSDPAMPFYGQVHWAAKAVVFRERGWFGGKDVEINSHKLPQGRRYARLRDLVEGDQTISSAVLDALSVGDCQWALELTAMTLNAAEEEPEKSDPSACPNVDEELWTADYNISSSRALELREVYMDWRSRMCQRMQHFRRTAADFDDPLRHGRLTYSKGSVHQTSPRQKEAVTPEEERTCAAMSQTPELASSTLRNRALFLCLRRQALWCLARRELPSSGRNWYLTEALTEREKSMEEISHFRIAHRIRQDFLHRVPDVAAVVRNFPERFEPGIISFDRVAFWINMVDSDADEEKRYEEQDTVLRPVRSPRSTTVQLIARNQILAAKDIDRSRDAKPRMDDFVDIWMTTGAMRSILLKQYPAGPLRLFLMGDIWFEYGDWATKVKHFCNFLEILLAIEHE